jgi:Icc-related predicted phosphoesterase
MTFRIVAISDTHGYHEDLEIPKGDLLVHCGDFTRGLDSLRELPAFSEWMTSQPTEVKLLCPGNHDCIFEEQPDLAKQMFSGLSETFGSILMFNHSFFMSSYQRIFCNWAFNREEEERERMYNSVPSDLTDQTQVLVSHAPPWSILDTSQGKNLGCKPLYDFKERMPRLKLHLFGHIHGQGTLTPTKIGNTLYVNCAVLNDKYELVRKPVVIDIEENGDVKIV